MKNLKLFKGAGYIIGASMGIILATVIYIFTKNLVVSIPAAVATGISLGIGFEEKIQKNDNSTIVISRKILASLFLAGSAIFATILILLKYI